MTPDFLTPEKDLSTLAVVSTWTGFTGDDALPSPVSHIADHTVSALALRGVIMLRSDEESRRVPPTLRPWVVTSVAVAATVLS